MTVLAGKFTPWAIVFVAIRSLMTCLLYSSSYYQSDVLRNAAVMHCEAMSNGFWQRRIRAKNSLTYADNWSGFRLLSSTRFVTIGLDSSSLSRILLCTEFAQSVLLTKSINGLALPP